MKDKLFDLAAFCSGEGAEDMRRCREIFAKAISASNASEDDRGLMRKCLEVSEGFHCGSCGRPILDYFYAEIVSEEPRKTRMVCPSCWQPDKNYVGEEDGE